MTTGRLSRQKARSWLAWLAAICMLAALPALYPSVAAASMGQDSGSAMLMKENFYYFGEVNGISGWVVDSAGCTFAASPAAGMTVKDNSDTDAFQMSKEFVRQTENVVTAEIRYKRSGLMSTAFMLLDGDTPVVKIGTMGSYVGYITADGAFVSLWKYSKACRIRLVLDLQKQTFSIYQNGVSVGSGLPFFAKRNTVNKVLFRTSTEETGNVTVETIRVYTGYAVNDSYELASEEVLPDGYTVSDNATALPLKMDGHGAREAMGLRMTNTGDNTAELTRTFGRTSCKTDISFLVMHRAAGEGAAVQLKNVTTTVLELRVRDGVWTYKDGDTYRTMAYTTSTGKQQSVHHRAELWYNFRLVVDPAVGKADIYVNYKPVATGVTVPRGSFDRLTFATAADNGADVWLDDILVHGFNAPAKDYVAKPTLPKKSTDALIGFQSCDLHTNGLHTGWESATMQPAADTVLGFGEESNTEFWDWQIKYMTEHGADFMFMCWYENLDNAGTSPLVAPAYSYYLDGYMYSEYSQYLNFAIQVFGPYYSFEDYVNYIIPYWVEYYFTDPRYQLIDNKPLIGIGEWADFETAMGGEDKVKELFALLNRACRDAGFDGAYLLIQERGGNNAVRLGFDGAYSYNGTSDWKENKALNETSYNKLKDTDAAWVPTLSLGWSPEIWHANGLHQYVNNRMPAKDFTKLTEWIRQFSDSMPRDSLSGKLILVDNWNEIHEGHSIQPTYTYGWSHLESIASAFTTLSQKELIALRAVPTDAQRARYSTLFPKRWNGCMWDFDYGSDVTEMWTAGPGLTDLRADACGHLRGVVSYESGKDGYLQSAPGQHIAATADNILISLKNSGDMQTLRVYFTTDSSPKFSEDKSFAIAVSPENEQYAIYSIDASKNRQWKGTVTQLRVLFDVLEGGVGGVFSINYLYVLKNTDIAPTPAAGQRIEKLRTAYTYELMEPLEYYRTVPYQFFTAGTGVTTTLTGRITGIAAKGCTVKLDGGEPVTLTADRFTFKNVAIGRHVLYVRDAAGRLLSRRQLEVRLGNKAGYTNGVITVTETGSAPVLTFGVSAVSDDVPSEPGSTVTPAPDSTVSDDPASNNAHPADTSDPAQPSDSPADSSAEPTSSTAEPTKPVTGSDNGSALPVIIGIGTGILVIAAAALAILLIRRKRSE